MGQKQKRIRQKERQDYADKRGDLEKRNQTDSPEIPDRGRPQKSPASLWGKANKHTAAATATSNNDDGHTQ